MDAETLDNTIGVPSKPIVMMPPAAFKAAITIGQSVLLEKSSSFWLSMPGFH